MKRCGTILTLALLFLAAAVQAYGADGYVRGTVLTSAGEPAGSVWVFVKQGDAEKGRSLTGDDGIYHVGGLEAGTYKIVVLNGGRQELYSGVIELPRDQSFDIRLP